jgi:monoamine oxidase
MTTTADVIVIGAGLSGLRTADLLTRAGLDVQVLEARDRCGGRTRSEVIHGAHFDIGGQWVGPTQRRVLALGDELGLTRFPTPCTGDQLLRFNGRTVRYSGMIPSLPVHTLAVVQAAIWAIEKRARNVPAGRPAEARNAQQWDRHTILSWCEKYIPSSDARDLIYLTARSILSAEPEEVSFLYFLHYIKNAGAIDPLVTTEGGAQQWRFVEGAQSLSDQLASRLPNPVHLGEPVLRIEQKMGRAFVHTSAGEYSARAVVVTTAVSHRGTIAYEPPLPPAWSNLSQRMPMGHTIKCLAFYDRPFWREAGLSGESSSFHDLLAFTFDNSSHDDSVYCLVGFVNGKKAAELCHLSEPDQQQAVLDALATLFGPDALLATDFIAHDWNSETWGAGCPVAVSGPGTLTGQGHALYQSTGRIHFAGTESASQWGGFMEGALQSAERVAEEVVASLG